MNKQDLIDLCLAYCGAYEDHPFDNHAGAADPWTVMRHSANQKSFAYIFERNARLCINLKCDPLESQYLRQNFADIEPAYHMNKVHWNTIAVDGDVVPGELQRLIEASYDLTKPKTPKAPKK